MELTRDEARKYVERIGPTLGYDFTENPTFPKERNDVAVVRHTAENGNDYGYDTIYLVWKEADGTIKHKELGNSRATKDYLYVRSISAEGDEVKVNFGSTGSFCGVPFDKAKAHDLKTGATADVKSGDFQSKAQAAMLQVVEEHRHNHPLYVPTQVKESVIDAEHSLLAFVLFEQIDTDRHDAIGEGHLGDQFRYSVWKMNGDNKPVQLYEDHAYIRPQTPNPLTGTRGRDCSLKNLKIENGVIAVETAGGQTLAF